MVVMVELLVAAMERADSTEAGAVARSLEGLSVADTPLHGLHQGTMRAEDHQFIQPLVVSEMQRAGTPGTRFDVEGSGYGFRTVARFEPVQTAQPAHCRMVRPSARESTP
jgi:branched-chain amino acid transport system substrate-binding protein